MRRLVFVFVCFSISARTPNTAELAYLKLHEVPSILKKRLDAIFSGKTTRAFLRGDRSKKILDKLEESGFTFFNTKRTYVFYHKELPEYIFKIRNEDLQDPPNFSRIHFAQEIANYCTENNLPIMVPKKWVYFSQDEMTEGIIVVAQRIDLTNAPPRYNPPPALKLALLQLENALGYKDFHAHNVIALDGGAIIIDTEKS